MKKAKPPQTRASFSLKFLLSFFIAIFCFLALFSSGTLDSEDGWLYLTVARNIYYHHQLTASPQSDYAKNNVNMNSIKGADGIWRAPGATGYSISMVPAVALSDIIHRHFNSPAPEYFPLESDWTLLFFASFTNFFWVSMLAVLLLFYGQAMGWTKRNAMLFSLITIFTTNLFTMAKFSFAQMMFTFFLILTFYLVKRFVERKNIVWFLAISMSFLAMMVTYNVSYYLAVGPLALYYLFLHRGEEQKKEFLKLSVLGLIVVLVKFSLVKTQFLLVIKSLKVLFEGVWGFLFSSGKSIFLYSPVLLILPIFWHKLRKSITPELIGFGSLAIFFLIFLGSAWIPNPVGKTPIWNGGMGWGTRYFIPAIPGLMLIVFAIIQQLSKNQKKFIVMPLLLLGLFIQVMGASVSYLLQYTDIPYNIFVGKEELSVYDYASFIPRYSPLLKMPHVVAAIAYRFPQTIMHGPNDVKFYDGFDLPLNLGNKLTFRGFREEGHISFSESNHQMPKSISLILSNAPDALTSSESASISINSKNVVERNLILPINIDTPVSIDPAKLTWQGAESYLDLSTSYTATPSAPHVIYIKQMMIDGKQVNLGSLDYPDSSSINYNFKHIPYQYYGGKVQDPWALWNLRARINERTFDFWWVKNLYYWDRLRTLVWGIFALDISALAIAVLILSTEAKKEFTI